MRSYSPVHAAMISKTLLIGFMGAAAGALFAGQPDLSKLPPSAAKAGVTYEQDIRPILKASCFNCHGSQRQRGGLRLDSLEAALQGGDDGKVITPGKSKA